MFRFLLLGLVTLIVKVSADNDDLVHINGPNLENLCLVDPINDTTVNPGCYDLMLPLSVIGEGASYKYFSLRVDCRGNGLTLYSSFGCSGNEVNDPLALCVQRDTGTDGVETFNFYCLPESK